MLKTVLVAPVATIEVVIGVIAVPTVALKDVCEEVTATGVMIVEVALVDGPDPAELVATTVTAYSVPGLRPVIDTGDEIADEEGEAVPAEPEETGETVTV
jgi:hypothetical protein